MPLTDAAPVLLDPVCVRARVQYFLFPFFFITVKMIFWINIKINTFVVAIFSLLQQHPCVCACVHIYIYIYIYI